MAEACRFEPAHVGTGSWSRKPLWQVSGLYFSATAAVWREVAMCVGASPMHSPCTHPFLKCQSQRGSLDLRAETCHKLHAPQYCAAPIRSMCGILAVSCVCWLCIPIWADGNQCDRVTAGFSVVSSWPCCTANPQSHLAFHDQPALSHTCLTAALHGPTRATTNICSDDRLQPKCQIYGEHQR